ncbi:MAG TPA: hypothetical protein VLB81_12280, partial [Gaiellales bacterium]|nr:hypothetical protein [Gaiellales bacterium]
GVDMMEAGRCYRFPAGAARNGRSRDSQRARRLHRLARVAAPRLVSGCERAGVTPRPSPYDCRHGFVSMLLHEHRSLPYVAAAVGHASASMSLDRYSHALHEAQLATAVSMVDAIMDARRRVRIPCATEPVRRLRQAAPNG